MANAYQWVSQVPFLYQQQFESGSVPTNWVAHGTANFGWTGGLQGTFSLLCPPSAIGAYTLSPTVSEIFGSFLWLVDAIPVSNSTLFELDDAVSATVFRIVLLSTGAISVSDGSGAVGNSSGTVSVATSYRFWWHYKAGSGANAIGSTGFSTTGTEPVSGPNFASYANGAGTTNGNTFNLFNATAASNMLYDDFILNLTDVGNNPS